MGIKGNQPKGSTRIKEPQIPSGVSSDELHPLFSFEYFDRDYYHKRCDKKQKSALADTIIKLSQLAWKDIRKSNYKANGFETIPIGEISGHRPEILREDVPYLHVFRYFGLCPMLGVKRGHLYYVIWLDNEMKRYNHGS